MTSLTHFGGFHVNDWTNRTFRADTVDCTAWLSWQVSGRWAGRCRAAQLARIRLMSGHVSRGSAGEYQADERAGVARLSWRLLGRWARKCPGAQLKINKQMKLLLFFKEDYCNNPIEIGWYLRLGRWESGEMVGVCTLCRALRVGCSLNQKHTGERSIRDDPKCLAEGRSGRL